MTGAGTSGRGDAVTGVAPSAAEDDPVRVLLVDDARPFAELAARLLAEADQGLAVTVETTAAAALERLGAASFDCVVCDFRRPELDGPALARAVAERAPEVPCLVFTWADRETVDAAAAGVVDGYLQKSTAVGRYETLAERVRALAAAE
jgi:two-component system CheB/CheR fusion protein